jgi:uncharacterized protein YuzE
MASSGGQRKKNAQKLKNQDIAKSEIKIQYDPEVDALSIIFRKTTVTSKELADGICADYDSDGRLAGLEILDAKLRFAGNDSFQKVELEGMTPVVV